MRVHAIAPAALSAESGPRTYPLHPDAAPHLSD